VKRTRGREFYHSPVYYHVAFDVNRKTETDFLEACFARYARGRDYHRVFEKKLRRIARALREEFGATARATVDYGPLLERVQ